MKRDTNKKRIYRIKVNDEERRTVQAAIMNRLILDGKPIGSAVLSTDPAIVDGDCLVRICNEWIISIASKISSEDLDETSY